MVNVTIYGIHGSYGYVSIFPIKRYQIGSYHELPRVSQSHDRLGKMMRYGCLDDFGMDMIEPMLRKSDSGGSRSRDADWPIVEFLSWLTFSWSNPLSNRRPMIGGIHQSCYALWFLKMGIAKNLSYATVCNHTQPTYHLYRCDIVVHFKCAENTSPGLGMKWNWGLLDKMGACRYLQFCDPQFLSEVEVTLMTAANFARIPSAFRY